MRSRSLGFLLSFIIGLFLVSGSVLAEDQTAPAVKQDTDSLQQRLLRLEAKVADQERTINEQKKTACALNENLETINSRLKTRLEEEGPCWYKQMAVDAAITSVLQGSGNTREGGDRTDGSLRMQLGFTSTAVENGTIRLEFRQGENADGLMNKVNTFTGINDSTYGEDGDDIIYEAWYEQRSFGDKLRTTIGKLDFTNYFDSNEVAHCECTQFLASGFVWNPAIEFAGSSLGAIMNYAMDESLYLRLGAMGTDDTWQNALSRPFAIAEVGFSPKTSYPGNYRVFTWLNAGRHDKWDNWQVRTAADSTDTPEADDAADKTAEADATGQGWGAGFSLDQQVSESISLFARAGYQAEDYYPFDVFWSAGGQIAGKGWNRPDDAAGIAYGMALLGDEYKSYETSRGNDFTNKDEGHLEIYYRIQVNKNVSVSPDFQILFHPLGDSREDTVYVGAVRGFAEF